MGAPYSPDMYPYDITWSEAVGPTASHNAFGHTTFTMHNGHFEQAPGYGSSMYTSTQEAPDQNVVDGSSMQHSTHPIMYNGYSKQQSTHRSVLNYQLAQQPSDPVALDNIFNEDLIDADGIQSTLPTSYTEDNEDHLVWY